MSKIVVAIVSFTLGCCSALLVPLNARQTAMSVAPQQTDLKINWPHSHMTISGGSAEGGQAIDLSSFLVRPIFNSLDNTPVFKDFTVTRATQLLDGFHCENCTFEDAVLEYSGGAFNLQNLKLSGTTMLRLTGAAANTVSVLGWLSAVSRGVVQKPPTPNRPITKKAKTPKPLQMDVSPPFIDNRK